MSDDWVGSSRRTYRAREAVGVFVDPEALEAAVQRLVAAGFDRGTLSVLGSEDEIAKHFGHLYYRVEAIADDARAPRTSFASAGARLRKEMAAVVFPLYIGGLAGLAAVVASGGALAVAIAGIIVGSAAGAGVGGFLANAIADHHRHEIEEQLARGGLVLWVKVVDPEAERHALAILKRSHAGDVHVHQIPQEHPIQRTTAPS
jgi:hypothetical protein